MKFIILGKNIDVTEGLRSAVEDKIGKLEKYFSPETEVRVTLSVEKDRQKIEVTIPVKGKIIRSEQVSNDMYVSIDLVEEIIERQLKKYKTKIVDQQQNASYFKLDNITVGYSFQKLFNMNISGRVYATAQNIFTITKYDGLDPEIQEGIESSIYPRPFTTILGVNLNF